MIDTVSFIIRRPERLHGWQILGFAVLLVSLVGSVQWFNWGRLFNDGRLSDRRALLFVGIQIVSLIFLVGGYDSFFAWFSLVLVYQVVGGLPPRYWPPLLIGALLILVVSLLPRDGSTAVDVGSLTTGLLLFVSNLGIAVFIRLLGGQRDQLHSTLAQLRQAHAALAASAAQSEELAVLRERTRLARTMHDNLGHALVVVNVKLEAAQLLYKRDPAQGDAELEAIRSLIRGTMVELRHALSDLRAPVTDHDNLPDALKRLAKETQERAKLNVACSIANDLLPLPIDAREALWYVAREALTNVERHSAATRVSLTFGYHHDGWLLRVEDNGYGISPTDLRRPEHYGVVGMRERINLVSGRLSIERAASGGTVVEAYLPATVMGETKTP